MRRILQSPKWIPLFFALITIIAYGLLLPFTGFYWDDWPFAWAAKFLGPAQFIPSFAGFRPFLGPIFFITTSLIPSNPILWQIFALIIRFAAALSAWFALNQIWPRYKFQTLIASLLFLVFPGFSQHWVAFTHINQEWVPLHFLFAFVWIQCPCSSRRSKKENNQFDHRFAYAHYRNLSHRILHRA